MTNARRGRGEGSIFQRADGLWVATLNLGYDGKGKRSRRTIYGHTKREVQEKLIHLQSDTANGILVEPNKTTVGLFLKQWLETTVRTSVRETTLACYSNIIRNHITPKIGGIPLSKLSPIHVQGFYSSMEKEGKSDRMRRLVHAVLHRALEQALRWNMIQHNVCDAVEKPRVQKKTMKVLSPEQAKEFLKAAKGDRLEALYILAITTGLRQGELLALHWEHIDLKAGTLSVVQTLQEINGVLKYGEPKSGKGRRLVTLPEIAISALKEHRKKMLAEGHPGPLVFPDTEGKPIRKSNLLRRWFKPLLKEARLPNIRFHDLRHTAATLLLSQGVHPKVVQERLGHSQISLTLDTYSHVLPSMQQEAASRIDELFTQRCAN